MSDCEWNPYEDRAALVGMPPHAEATLLVGAWHLCEVCAGLPQFRAMKRRPLKRNP